jgi:hypothetical protein
MRRREFIAVFGGAVAGPLVVRAQQAAAVPVAGGNRFSQLIASRWREADDGPYIGIPHKATFF